MGTREQLNLESLIAEAGGDVAGKAALAAAINMKTKKPAAAEGGGAEAEGGGGGAAGEEEEEDPRSEDSEAVANLALDNGEASFFCLRRSVLLLALLLALLLMPLLSRLCC